jgi:hypothetical protein
VSWADLDAAAVVELFAAGALERTILVRDLVEAGAYSDAIEALIEDEEDFSRLVR